jgi:hypothetical protein
MLQFHQRMLGGLSLLLGAVALYVVPSAKAQGLCADTRECTFYEGSNEIPGMCGLMQDGYCGCFYQVGGIGQHQAACNPS